jgi:hypothetical protein
VEKLVTAKAKDCVMPYPEILMVNRRKVLEDAFKISVGLVLGTTSRIAFGSDKALELTPNHAAWVHLPANFTGLGYEMSDLALRIRIS